MLEQRSMSDPNADHALVRRRTHHPCAATRIAGSEYFTSLGCALHIILLSKNP